MKINLSPQRRDDSLPEVTLSGTILTINGDELDLSDIPEGATYPNASDLNPWLTDSIERSEGDFELTILLPHGANPEQYQAFPEPLIVTEDGPVDLPSNTVVTEDTLILEPSEEYPFGAVKHVRTVSRWRQADEVTETFFPNPEPEPEVEPEPEIEPEPEDGLDVGTPTSDSE